MSVNLFFEFKNIKAPSFEELCSIAKKEYFLFPDRSEINENWMKISIIYKYLFSLYFLKKTGLDFLDKKIKKLNISGTDSKKSFFEKYDYMNLDFFYLRCWPRVERLSEDDKKTFLDLYDNLHAEDKQIFALACMSSTFKKVMTINPDSPSTVYELKPTIHGDYQVSGEEIPIVLHSKAAFDKDGEVLYLEKEEERIVKLTNVWKQIDKALSNDLGCATKTMIELFNV